ncbi:MAG: tRNA (cytidine(34)-2'-O)-methyltransferase [Alphaproteobacteria bacterium]|nr:tRNA (cytidine(34)-2'-O)-methyltransferase [Alphaproteobacteria bacterium]
MRLALYEPDIPQNTGTLIRLGACLAVPVDIIEPCGFAFGNRAMRRAGLDYIELANVAVHGSWTKYLESRGAGRLVLLSTKADLPYPAFSFRPDDTLLLGRESAGVPDEVHLQVDARLIVPMAPGRRSLNVAVAAAMVLGEALRQSGRFALADLAA